MFQKWTLAPPMDTNGMTGKIPTPLQEVGLRISAHKTALRRKVRYYSSRNTFIDCAGPTGFTAHRLISVDFRLLISAQYERFGERSFYCVFVN